MALFAIAVQTHDLLGLPGFLRPIVRYGDVLAGIIVAKVAITHHFVIDRSTRSRRSLSVMLIPVGLMTFFSSRMASLPCCMILLYPKAMADSSCAV